MADFLPTRMLLLLLGICLVTGCSGQPKASLSSTPSTRPTRAGGASAHKKAPPLPTDPRLVDAVLTGKHWVSPQVASENPRCELLDLLARGDYDGLERRAEQARAQASHPETPWPPPGRFYADLANAHGYTFWVRTEEHVAHLRRWVRDRPRSVTARIVLARAMVLAKIWEVKELEFDARELQSMLTEAEGFGVEDPELYVAHLEVGLVSQASSQEMEGWYQQACALQPDYLGAVAARGLSLLPDRKARRGAQDWLKAIPDRTTGFYSREELAVLTYMWMMNHPLFWKASARADFDYKLFYPGFLALEKRFPDSAYIENWFLSCAIHHDDARVAPRLVKAIGPGWDRQILVRLVNYQRMRDWAESNAEAPGAEVEPVSLPAAPGYPVDNERVYSQQFVNQVTDLLYREKFEELDQIWDRLERERPVLPSGSALQYWYLDGAAPAAGQDKEYQEVLELQQRWLQARPDSVAARIAQAQTLRDYAWEARGDGWASDVTPEGWKYFEERLTRADQVLQGLKQPNAYALACQISIGMGQGADPQELRKLMDQAVKLNPTCREAYSSMAQMLLPRWGGEPGELGRMLAKAPPEVYAEIFYRYSNPKELRSEAALDWATARKGFQTALKSRPRSLLVANKYAFAACSVNDMAAAREAFEIIGPPTNFDPGVWGLDRAQFETYRDEALGRGMAN